LFYLIVEIAAPLALVVSLTLRWAYLRAVRRSMLRPVIHGAPGGDDGSSALARRAAPAPAHPLEIVPAAVPAHTAVRSARRGPWIAVAVHVVGGLTYALAVTAAYVVEVAPMLTTVGGASFGWRFWVGTLWFCLFYAWPVVIVVSLLVKLSWRTMVVVVIVCAALFVGAAWLMIGGVSWTVPQAMQDAATSQGVTAPPSISLLQVVDGWWSMDGIATLVVLAFLVRPIRAIGPVVLALTVAALSGAYGMVFLFAHRQPAQWLGTIATKLGFDGRIGVIAVVVMVLGVGGVAACLLGYLALRGIGRLYTAQWMSEQSIQVYAVWLVFALAQPAPPGMPYACLVAVAIYVLVVRLGLRLFGRRNRVDGPPPRLLLLRVFSLGRRSESLFDAFSRLWRHTGSVQLIAGPDLANSTVEPHEFLDFLGGRLQRRFISDPATLDRRLAETSLRPDPDNRFRVFEFFCHADTWQMVLRRLVGESDAVLMDLRGFTRTNKGCIFELHELLDTVPLERVLLVVDHTTDHGFLADVLHQGWLHISADSPNRTDACPRVHLYHLDRGGARRIGELVATVAGAHGRSLVPATV
jgi:hypothetical protein